SVRYSNPFRYEGCVWDDGPYIRVSFAGFVPPNQGGEDVGPRDKVGKVSREQDAAEGLATGETLDSGVGLTPLQEKLRLAKLQEAFDE
ncbi:MAG: hypothetical protein ACREBU_09340, partial [Nitrososphaera sp.]